MCNNHDMQVSYAIAPMCHKTFMIFAIFTRNETGLSMHKFWYEMLKYETKIAINQ